MQQLFSSTLNWWIVDEKMNSPSTPRCSQKMNDSKTSSWQQVSTCCFKTLFWTCVFLLSNLLLTFCFKKICFWVITLSLCIKILIMPAIYMSIVVWSKTFKWQTDSLRHTSFLITPFQRSLEGFITPPLATCLPTTILWELPPQKNKISGYMRMDK